MKPFHVIGLFCMVAVLIACTGCTNSAPATPATPAPTTVLTTTATPVPEPTVYPGALALNQMAAFGIAGQKWHGNCVQGRGPIYLLLVLPVL